MRRHDPAPDGLHLHAMSMLDEGLEEKSRNESRAVVPEAPRPEDADLPIERLHGPVRYRRDLADSPAFSATGATVCLRPTYTSER